MTNRKSHTPFRLVLKSTTLVTVSGRYALCRKKHAPFGEHRKNLNEDSPTLSAAKMLSNDSSFWWYKVGADIRGGFLGRWRQKTVGLSTTAIISVFAGYFSETLERPALLCGDMHSVLSFSVIQKCMTFNGYFALNSVFAPVWLTPTVRRSKNNCAKSWKTNKDRHILSVAQIFGRDQASGNVRHVRVFARIL